MSNSTEFNRSRYVHGGTTERYPTRLGWWSRRNIPKSADDIFVTLDARYHRRAWMVAHDYYQDHNLEWLILQYNSILDVNEEFVAGKVIRIPTSQRLGLEILNGSLGGKRMVE